MAGVTCSQIAHGREARREQGIRKETEQKSSRGTEGSDRERRVALGLGWSKQGITGHVSLVFAFCPVLKAQTALITL